MSSLLLLACSRSKLDTTAPAIDLYRGVMYQTYRAHVDPQAKPHVIILSALHGFVMPETVISPYEQKMTPRRVEEMLVDLDNYLLGVDWPKSVSEVFLAGGKEYRKVMRAAAERMAPDATISEVNGGIGMQRSQLGRYLDRFGK